ncbi:MAG TPA: biotin transporter BioY [Candidatus Dormibacteraeota bacterium]|nr:biotin transporter BioY [Candidatus Dormibacteraeota bacterium]
MRPERRVQIGGSLVDSHRRTPVASRAVLDVATSARPRPVLADLIPGERVRDLAVVAGYAGLVGLSAQLVIHLPFTPVPITGQTFGVLLGGLAVGTRRGAAGMLLYLVLGLVGIPWFAGGDHGLSMLSAPSFGYVIGFVFAACALGWLARRGFDRRPLTVVLALVAGNAVIYLFGATWLAWRLHVGASQAISLGVSPFLLGDALKAALAAALLPAAWKLSGRSTAREPPLSQ